MADDDVKKPSIPAWQRAGKEEGRDDAPAASATTTPTEAIITGKVQIEDAQNKPDITANQERAQEQPETSDISQVQKFLADPTVKSAPLDKKRLFLESKGVENELIKKVLEETTSKVIIDAEEFRRTMASPAVSSVTRDVPPVVTYPEFLIQPQKPPPLITFGRLFNTAYVVGGMAATLYGVSKYIVAPMTETLTASRHDFASHTEEQLEKLNEKLGGMVTAVPTKAKDGDAIESDADSVASDPTELFHRDTGTQTSPQISRRQSASTDDTPPPIKTVAEKQEDRLRILSSHMSELLDGANESGIYNDALQERVGEVRKYLDTLIFPPASSFENGVWQQGSSTDKKKDDAVSAFRAEIRGVKGVLLNARRFPAGTGPGTARVGA